MDRAHAVDLHDVARDGHEAFGQIGRRPGRKAGGVRDRVHVARRLGARVALDDVHLGRHREDRRRDVVRIANVLEARLLDDRAVRRKTLPFENQIVLRVHVNAHRGLAGILVDERDYAHRMAVERLVGSEDGPIVLDEQVEVAGQDVGVVERAVLADDDAIALDVDGERNAAARDGRVAVEGLGREIPFARHVRRAVLDAIDRNLAVLVADAHRLHFTDVRHVRGRLHGRPQHVGRRRAWCGGRKHDGACGDGG